MTPAGNLVFTLETIRNQKGEDVDVAPGDGHIVWVPVPDSLDTRFALLLRNLPHSAAK